MAAGILPTQRREIVVRGDGNCSYQAIALWSDETGDRKQEEIRRLSSSFTEQHPQVFQPFLFCSSSVEEHERKITAGNHFLIYRQHNDRCRAYFLFILVA